MFRSFWQFIETHFENFIERRIDESYKSAWESQNHAADVTKKNHEKETNNLKTKVSDIERKIKILKRIPKYLATRIRQLKKANATLAKSNEGLSTCINNLNEEIKTLRWLNVGANLSIRDLKNKNQNLEEERKKMNDFIQRIVKECNHKLTPATLQEMRNYDLYGSRKGRKE
ncbi:MAG: hypothetical protein OSJ70_04835 [Bacilli bacterium]|nr:hypothetical protein [Bacilli bacterium]